MRTAGTILIAAGDSSFSTDIQQTLSEEGCTVSRVHTGAAALAKAGQADYDLIFIDDLFAGMKNLKLLSDLARLSPCSAMIVISEKGTIQRAVKAVKNGASEWIDPSVSRERLLEIIRRSVEHARFSKEKHLSTEQSAARYGMTGVSKKMRHVFGMIERMAKTNSTVLITGESGTGKDKAAAAIHRIGSSSRSPFVHVNCAAVPDTLIESELFGHTKGAFTGAVAEKKGKFQLADGGTLFLDEIGDLSITAQAKVLRAIELGEVYRIGSEHAESVTVRLITATNRNLEYLVSRNLFREDLYHRIHVIAMELPSLRSRPEDIIPLITAFFRECAARNKTAEKKLLPDAEAAVLAYHWPGNVRELRNFAERLTVLVDTETVSGSQMKPILKHPDIRQEPDIQSLKNAREIFEKNYLIKALKLNSGNIAATARALEMPRSLLYRKLEKHRIRTRQQ